MDKLQVRVKGPIARSDRENNWLIVKPSQFNKDPRKVYEVPNNAFWQMQIANGDLLFAGKVDKSEEPVKSEKA
jgi:hypothetical protein